VIGIILKPLGRPSQNLLILLYPEQSASFQMLQKAKRVPSLSKGTVDYAVISLDIKKIEDLFEHDRIMYPHSPPSKTKICNLITE
jgi:hypothetical protein